MSGVALLLGAVLATVAPLDQAGLSAGLEALQAGRNEDAVRLLEAATTEAPSYEGLVALGLARGRLGRLDQAAEALARAIAVDPRRPEARVELGGVLFLERRYDESTRELRRALRARGDDEYTRELLASSLHLAGRSEEALEQWNALGRPVLESVEVRGLVHTRDVVARREIAVAVGQVLDVDGFRETRLRLHEAGVFDRISLRPVPTGTGTARLQVDLVERHGLANGWLELAGRTGVDLLSSKVRVRYANVRGSGLTAGAQYRWKANRPGVSVFMELARPFGLPANLRLQGAREEQAYDLDGRFRLNSRGIDLGLRKVLDGATVGTMGLRHRDRSSDAQRSDVPGGRIVGLEAGLERRLVRSPRQRLDGSVRGLRSLEGLGADLSFGQASAALRYHLDLRAPDGSAVERSALAAQLHIGASTAATPLDERFAPGGNREMELPLRAHARMRRGTLGGTPIGRGLALLNVEARQRVVNTKRFQLGVLFLYDGLHLTGTATGGSRLHDVGAGVRLQVRGLPLLRLDFGHGLTDGNNAVFVGLGHVF